jgi:hypothetical protein
MMRRIDNFTARHPILSMIAGYLLLVAFALTMLPADPQIRRASMWWRTGARREPLARRRHSFSLRGTGNGTRRTQRSN